MTCFFSFFFVFVFSLGFRASGITCIWFSIEKMFLEVKNIVFFFGFFLTKKCKNMKNNEKLRLFFEKKGNHIRTARVFLARCAAENPTILCALVAFWVPESCVVSCAL